MSEGANEEAKAPTKNPVRASWNFSHDDLRAYMSHYNEADRDLLIAAFRWCNDDRHLMSRQDFARRVGYSENAIYKIFTGRYADAQSGEKLPPPADLLKAIREFLKVERERHEGGQNKFIITPTARRIFLASELARESQSPVILHGASHIGKTWALRYHSNHENHGKTPMVELEAASGLGGMVRQIARGLAISDNANTADLIFRIKKALTPQMVLILDELHLLANTYRLNSYFACVEVLRRIYDFTECGMVLSWTHLENLHRAKDKELVQIWRRGVHKIALPSMPTKGDLAVILHASGLAPEFPALETKAFDRAVEDYFRSLEPVTVELDRLVEKPREILRQVAKRDGLKAVTERLRYARKLASKNGDKLAWEHFVGAHLRIEKQTQAPADWI